MENLSITLWTTDLLRKISPPAATISLFPKQGVRKRTIFRAFSAENAKKSQARGPRELKNLRKKKGRKGGHPKRPGASPYGVGCRASSLGDCTARERQYPILGHPQSPQCYLTRAR